MNTPKRRILRLWLSSFQGDDRL